MSINKTAIVEKLFQLVGEKFGEEKWDEVELLLHPDFEMLPAASHPYAGVYRGLAGFQELRHKVFNETYDLFEPTLLEFAEGPHTVVSLLSVKVTGKQTGQTITMSLAEVFRFEDGKIRSIAPHYMDTKVLVEL